MTDPAVLALAESWAEIDGKLAKFMQIDHPGEYREGYIEDAKYMIECLKRRGYTVAPMPETATVYCQVQGYNDF